MLLLSSALLEPSGTRSDWSAVKQKGGVMGFQGRGGFGGPREMHKATCEECKQECEVPFKPSGDRPVYCKECFSKRKRDRG